MEEIPKSIRNALVKPKERVFLLRLEKELISFLRHLKGGNYLINGQLLINSYYRLLSHQLCQFYHLQHWNLQNSDIIVTPTEMFDYSLLISQIDQGQKETLSSYTRQIKVQEQPMATSAGAPGSNDGMKPKIMPRMLTKKPTLSETSLSLNNSSELIDNINDSETAPTTESTTESTTPQSQVLEPDACKLQNDRNDKEALYMKVRQEIFDAQNNEDDEEEEEEEEDDEDESDDNMFWGHPGFDRSYGNPYGYDQINPPAFGSYDIMPPMHPNMMPPQMMGMPYGMPMNAPYSPTYSPNMGRSLFGKSRSRSQSTSTNQSYQSHQSQASSPQQNKHTPHTSPQVQMNPNMPWGAPMPYYNNMMMMPNQMPSPNMPMNGGPMNGGYYQQPYDGSYGLPYDKETERKLLNNPYIIIPDTHHTKKSKKLRPKPSNL